MRHYLPIPFVYLIAGIAWIVASDRAVEQIAPSLASVTYFQTVKGWLFVLASAALLFVLTRRAHLAHRAAEAERYALFHETVQGAHHILGNYLNQMQLVALEAERHPEFDAEVLRLAREATARAAAALSDLDALPAPTPSGVHSALYPVTRQPPTGG